MTTQKPPRLTDAARQLRRQETPAERALWAELRARRLADLKFRRQHPFGPFVLDFCCPDHRLVVELDGSVHDTQTEQDAYRTEYITSFGYRVLRFRNDEVLTNLPTVLAQIAHAAEEQTSLTPQPPLPPEGEGEPVRGQ